MWWVNFEPILLPGYCEVHRDLENLGLEIYWLVERKLYILTESKLYQRSLLWSSHIWRTPTCSESFTSDEEGQICGNIIVTYLEITCSESFTSEISLMEKVKASIIFWSPASLSGGWLIDWLIDWYKYDGLLVKNWIVLMISKFSSRFVCGFTKKYIPTFQMCGKKSRKSFCTLTMKYLNAKGAIVRFISKLCKLNWILKRSHKVYGINQIKHCHHWPFLLKWW